MGDAGGSPVATAARAPDCQPAVSSGAIQSTTVRSVINYVQRSQTMRPRRGYAGSGAPMAALWRRLGMEVIEAIDVRASVVQVAPCSKRLEHRLSKSTYEQLSPQQATAP